LELSILKQQAFEQLLALAQQHRSDDLIEYSIPYPKHEFLRYLATDKHLLLHGSRNPNISIFQPIRRSSDTVAFGQQAAVYAASDGIWPIVFAILDRQLYHGMFYNECSRVQLDSFVSSPFYAFAIEAAALHQQPWTDGIVYLLPSDSFVPRPPSSVNGLTVYYQEWVSYEPVQPISKLAVSPNDFPFLDEFWGFDAQVLLARMESYPETWPFGDLADEALYPIRPNYWRLRVGKQ
jgi:hypothetical protein